MWRMQRLHLRLRVCVRRLRLYVHKVFAEYCLQNYWELCQPTDHFL